MTSESDWVRYHLGCYTGFLNELAGMQSRWPSAVKYFKRLPSSAIELAGGADVRLDGLTGTWDSLWWKFLKPIAARSQEEAVFAALWEELVDMGTRFGVTLYCPRVGDRLFVNKDDDRVKLSETQPPQHSDRLYVESAQAPCLIVEGLGMIAKAIVVASGSRYRKLHGTGC